MSVAPLPKAERLQKLLASAGFASRRAVETWIEAGRVTVNGQVAKLGDRASLHDRVCVDGKPIDIAATVATGTEVLLYHKPLGEVTTRDDPQGRPTVFERLPPLRQGRWVAIGRLDVNTSGLLLFTSNGELAHRLMHPSSEIEREYRVRVRGLPTPLAVQRLLAGVQLDDGAARFDAVIADGRSASHAWYRVVLREGRNREVRRVWEAVGHEVSRLSRIRYASLVLADDLRPGAHRWASAAEVVELKKLVTAAEGV
jgi:23S rRNA pseudouridine2605 synthase